MHAHPEIRVHQSHPRAFQGLTDGLCFPCGEEQNMHIIILLVTLYFISMRVQLAQNNRRRVLYPIWRGKITRGISVQENRLCLSHCCPCSIGTRVLYTLIYITRRNIYICKVMYYRSYSWDLYYIYILQSYLFRGKVTRIVSRRICLDNRKIYIRILGTC